MKHIIATMISAAVLVSGATGAYADQPPAKDKMDATGNEIDVPFMADIIGPRVAFTGKPLRLRLVTAAASGGFSSDAKVTWTVKGVKGSFQQDGTSAKFTAAEEGKAHITAEIEDAGKKLVSHAMIKVRKAEPPVIKPSAAEMKLFKNAGKPPTQTDK